MRNHPYRRLEEADLTGDLNRNPESWEEYIRQAGGPAYLVDHWLAYGLAEALRTIPLTRYRYRSERTRAAIRAARVALHELSAALWAEVHR